MTYAESPRDDVIKRRQRSAAPGGDMEAGAWLALAGQGVFPGHRHQLEHGPLGLGE